ncbi:hypothetical protein SLE2022_192800 [Rubroshorea leprosula]
MADHDHHHHHHHRPHRLSVPQRPVTFSSTSSGTPRSYPVYPYPATPISTPSKFRISSLNSVPSKSAHNKSSLSFLLLLLLSLRSLYSLLPFLRSSPPSFSLFPFSFLLSLLSFLLSLSFFLVSKQNAPILPLSSLSHSQLKLLLAKSLLLATVFLIRFQALRYCGTAAMILAELSGNVAARFFAEGQNPNRNFSSSKVRWFCLLFAGLLFMSLSWDRRDCFPFAPSFVEKFGFLGYPRESCLRIWPMLLPFLSGFLGCYERVSMNKGSIRQLGRKQVRLITLFFATVFLFVPAVVSFFVFEGEGGGVSIGNFGWPLANTVVFGVLLSENYGEDKLVSSKDFQREFLVTFVCTLVLELFYFPELSLMGLVICGFLLFLAVRELDPVYSNYLELGLESSEPLSMLIMKPIRHILSERKSRKIALFLLINTAYMVVEFVVGFMSNSLGLISDACHMLFDCAALGIGLYASYISRLPANSQFNYGRGRFEVLSGYSNAVFLVLVGALIVLESFERILDPQEISTNSLLTVSIGGLVVNVVGLIFFHEEHHHAHGGSCSHSHTHSHSHSDSLSCSHHHHQHSHESHDRVGPDHQSHGKHHECIVVSNECHEHHQGDQHCSTHSFSEDNRMKNAECHEHHNHAPCHNPPGQSHGHDSQDGANNQNHHDHHHNNHCHASNDCAHNHNHHDHHHNNHSDHHIHGSLHCSSSRSSHTDFLEDHKGERHHDQFAGLHAHTHCSDAKSHIPLATNRSKQNKLSSNGKEPKKHHHLHIDHNMEGIFLHVLADTMGSVGVVISTLLIKYKGWLVADPACSIFISVLIVSSVIPLLRNSAEILLQRVPRAHEQSLRKAIIDVKKMKGVSGIQNLHIWSFTNTDVVGTLHLLISEEAEKDSIKAQVAHRMQDAGIKDLTLQVECVKER